VQIYYESWISKFSLNDTEEVQDTRYYLLIKEREEVRGGFVLGGEGF
jgi:hypothetical protein